MENNVSVREIEKKNFRQDYLEQNFSNRRGSFSFQKMFTEKKNE